MRYLKLSLFAVTAIAISSSCKMKSTENSQLADTAAKGTFAYDLKFLKSKDSVVVLTNNEGSAQIIISPKYQAKVFTSTADGEMGRSFGWVNYKEFDLKQPDQHMNGFGGEDRLWLGPEGSKFALFFKPGTAMTIDNWHTPAAIDHESWKLDSTDSKNASLSKTTIM